MTTPDIKALPAPAELHTDFPPISLGLIRPPIPGILLSSFLLLMSPSILPRNPPPSLGEGRKKGVLCPCYFPFVGSLTNLQKIMVPYVLSAFFLFMSPSISPDTPSIDWDQIHYLTLI